MTEHAVLPDRSDSQAWLLAQAAALRRAAALRPNLPIAIDWEGIAEELEAVAAAERNELKSRLEVTLEHLAELAYVPMPEPRHGWRRTVREQRNRLEDLLETSPSLRRFMDEVLERVWKRALRHLLAEYRLRDLPKRCPWTVEQILAEDWWPPVPEGLEEEVAAPA
jgi:hypothetical protein